MSDTITTKPGSQHGPSIKNPRVYDALRRQGYSKESAARISNAQAKRRRRKSYTVADLERAALKDCAPAVVAAIARAIPELPRFKGEQLAPGITRIHGNLCNVHGRYGRCPGGASATPTKPVKPKPKRQARAAKPKKGAAGRKVDPQKAREHAEDRAHTLQRRQEVEADRQARLARQQQRDQEHAADRQRREQERTQAAADKLRKQQEALAKPKKGGGGGGKKKPEKDTSTQDAARRSRERAQILRDAKRQARQSQQDARQARLDRERRERQDRQDARRSQHTPATPQVTTPEMADAARHLQAGEPLSQTDASGLIRNGLARRDRRSGELILTVQGQRATRQKAQSTFGGTKRSKLDDSVFAGPDRSFPITTAQDVRDAVRSLGRTTHDKAAVKRGIIRRARAIGATDALPETWRAKSSSSSSSFAVFKDARGAWRWTAISSTAYRDRDGEIVSTKALAEDVARADHDGVYGPLRWWHVPSLDLGDCDFNALDGRVLIESGTFRSERIARTVATHAADLEVSLGFVHLPSEPDADGVFHSIRRFERSLTPRGKASNLFTSFRVKELPMLDTIKKEALVKLGFDDAEIAALETRAAQTQKAADDQGVKYKAEEPAVLFDKTPAPTPQEITIGGVVYTLKAAPVVDPVPETTKDDGMGDIEAMADDAPMEEDTAAEGGLTLSPDDLSAIGQLIGEQLQGALAQIMGGLDLEKKVASHVQGLMQPYQAQKDSEAAEQKQQIAQLTETIKAAQAKLDDLLGLRPAVDPLAASFKASASNETVLQPDDPLLETIREQIPQGGAFDDLYKNLFPGIPAGVPGS